ncbi:MAG: MBL fold metallo-hydrolase [Eubacteriales bacterium]
MNTDAQGLLFGKWQIKPNVWAITNRWQNFMFLIEGKDAALLIDTGYGNGNIRAYVEQITKRPIRVINTHGHFDHTGGNGWWPEVWMTSASVQDCKTTFAPIHDEWMANKPYQNYQIYNIKEGDIINLGGDVEIEVWQIPGHHQGSVALLDKQNSLLFTGDELESGQVLMLFVKPDWPLKTKVNSHLLNMQRLKKNRHAFEAICPSHNGCMLLPDPYIDDFIELDKRILDGTAEVKPDTAGFGYAPDPMASGNFFAQFGKQKRAEYGLASIVYRDI